MSVACANLNGDLSLIAVGTGGAIWYVQYDISKKTWTPPQTIGHQQYNDNFIQATGGIGMSGVITSSQEDTSSQEELSLS